MGPTVAIWLRPGVAPPDPDQLLSIARLLDPAARSSTYFFVSNTANIGGTTDARREPRPFGLYVGEPGLDDGEMEMFAIKSIVGFTPSVAVHVYAYSNSRDDHLVLAEIALYLAGRFEAVIDFGGNLGELDWHPGWIAEIPYEVSESRSATYHVSDVRFLESWITDEYFHMIK